MLVWPSCIVFVIGAAALITGGIVGWVVLPDVIEEQIIENVELKTGTEQYDRWENLPFPLKFKVYVFEVLNPQEVLQGSNKPLLQEKGPYVYDQYRHKEVASQEGDNIKYKEIFRFEFNAEDSSPLSEFDNVTILNLPYHAIIQMAEETAPELMFLINAASNAIFNGQGVFLNTRINDLLFDGVPICPRGVPTRQCREISEAGSKNIRNVTDGTMYFSVFNHKNMTDDGLYKINSGEIDVQKLGEIAEWEGSDRLDFWRDNEEGISICNMINGTDSSIYAPFVRRKDTLEIFSSDICRSVTTHYSEDDTYKGIKGMKFKTGDDMFPAPSMEDEYSRCYCLGRTPGVLQENGCLKKGAMELISCTNSHIVLTKPHFLTADQDYLDGVGGISPDADKHETFVLVEPNTGSPLAGYKRVQFNVFSRVVTGMTATANLVPTLFPVLWLEEGIELPDDMIDMLNEKLLNPLKLVDIIRWTLIGIGIAFSVIGAICFIVAMTKNKKTTV